MFGNSKNQSRIETIIGENTELEGNIHTSESVRLDGKIKGEIRADSVVVGETGVILGDISANHVTVGGKVKGNVSSSALLEILPKGQVLGDIRTSKLVISDGSIFEGNCQMVRADGQVIEMSPNASLDEDGEDDQHLNGKMKVAGPQKR